MADQSYHFFGSLRKQASIQAERGVVVFMEHALSIRLSPGICIESDLTLCLQG
jgi:hypothetical protein